MTQAFASKRNTLWERARRAAKWTLAGYGLAQVIRLASNLVLTRLLVPEMFGVMGVAMAVLTILYLLADIGVHQNIVQSPRGDDPAFLDTAWVVQIFRGVFLWFVVCLVAELLHIANLRGLLPTNSVYASPELPFVIAVLSFTSVISGCSSTRLAVAERHLSVRRNNEISLLGQVVAVAVMIPLAVASRSIWALVAGSLVGTVTVTVLSHTWMEGHKNRFRVEKEALSEIFVFGRWIFLSSVVTVLAANGDRVILGFVVSAGVLGVYVIAATMMTIVQGLLTSLYESLVLPIASEIGRTERARLRTVYYQMRVPGDLILLFLAGLLFAAGRLVIDLLYDARYAAAGDMLQVLALSLIAVRYQLTNKVYIAVGLPRYQAIVNVARCVALYLVVPSMYYLAGLEGAIWGIGLYALATVPVIYYLNSKLGLIDIKRELVVLAAFPVGYAAGLGVVALGNIATSIVIR
jgi:O-antigen/teichoic acid export membrane protein